MSLDRKAFQAYFTRPKKYPWGIPPAIKQLEMRQARLEHNFMVRCFENFFAKNK